MSASPPTRHSAAALQSPAHDTPGRDTAGDDHETDASPVLAALLRREADHRIGNSLQLAGSLLLLEAAHIEDDAARDALTRAGRGLRLIAGTHRRLSDGGDPDGRVELDTSLLALCDELYPALVEPYGHTLLVNADPLQVPQALANAVAMIASELICNALKHAFPGRRGGLIEVACGYGADRHNLLLTVRDNGIGLPSGVDPLRGLRDDHKARPAPATTTGAAARRGGLGMRLLQGLVLQFHGSMLLLRDRPGAGYRITLPCDPPASASHPLLAMRGGTA